MVRQLSGTRWTDVQSRDRFWSRPADGPQEQGHRPGRVKRARQDGRAANQQGVGRLVGKTQEGRPDNAEVGAVRRGDGRPQPSDKAQSPAPGESKKSVLGSSCPPRSPGRWPKAG